MSMSKTSRGVTTVAQVQYLSIINDSRLICHKACSGNLKKCYPAFASWLERECEYECPAHVSLGANGLFYARMKKGNYNYNLPSELINRLESLDNVRRVWLGFGNTYVVQKVADEWIWNLNGCYVGLEPDMREGKASSGIKVRCENF